MKKILAFIALVLLSGCGLEPALFSGDLSILPEDKEIRMEGVLEKNMSKTGSYEYTLNGTWITFDDDFPLDELLSKKVMVTGKVVHVDTCKEWRDAHPEIYESTESYMKALEDPMFAEPQCRVGEQLRVSNMQVD